MKRNVTLNFKPEDRARLWSKFHEVAEKYRKEVNDLPVQSELSADEAKVLLEPFDFNAAVSPQNAIDFVVSGLTKFCIHSNHPRYFGLFNPASTDMGVVGDALAAVFNPQLATWNHAPFPIALEDHLIQEFGKKFGYIDSIDGTFCSGGAEANHTAILTAVNYKFPHVQASGLWTLKAQPRIYVSKESHHSFRKAAKISGLGAESVVEIPVTKNFSMDIKSLEKQIALDLSEGKIPFMIVGTFGTTSGGAIDSISGLAAIAKNHALWYHVDAAWGGAACLLSELQGHFRGIEASDSITFDAHKWLSVPMGAGLFLTRHQRILSETFNVITSYMPKNRLDAREVDPYIHSIQWSRRFIGLKLFLSLAVAGWQGYAEVIRHQVNMGNSLRAKLIDNNWKIINKTPLPVVCFVDASVDKCSEDYLKSIVDNVVSFGDAWISTTRIGNHYVIRACITNFNSVENDLDILVASLEKARKKVSLGA